MASVLCCVGSRGIKKFDRGDLYMPGMTWDEKWDDANAEAWVHARLVDMGVLKKEDAVA